MNPLNKKGSALTPEVHFDPQSSTLSIKGKSLPMNESDFFGELLQWLENYSQDPNDQTTMEIDLKYLNGKTIRSLLQILKQFQQLSANGKNIHVQWSIPENAEDIAELSRDILTGLKMPHEIRMN